MTRRGFDTQAAAALPATKWFLRVSPIEAGIDALERGIARRSRRIVAPRWSAGALPFRMGIQPLIERVTQRNLARVLEIARAEDAPLTTSQPDEHDG
jgi:hypothetical protein